MKSVRGDENAQARIAILAEPHSAPRGF